MMISYAAPLREARADVLPQMPTLLSELAEDRHVILNALKANFAQKDRDPDEVPRADWNKAERYAIVGHFISDQAGILVEGSGSDARFKEFQSTPDDERSRQNFKKSLAATQATGARQVIVNYRESDGFFGSRFTTAANRYRGLGMRAALTDGFVRSAGNGKLWVKPGAAPEGIFLTVGMRTRALRNATSLYMTAMVPATKDLPRGERLQAAHDLSQMPIGLTAMHLINVADRTFKIPPFKAVKDEVSGRYRAVYDDPDTARRWYGALFTGIPTERHKCPAHVRKRDPETGIRMDSALQNMFHAGLNASVEFGYYDL